MNMCMGANMHHIKTNSILCNNEIFTYIEIQSHCLINIFLFCMKLHDANIDDYKTLPI